MNNEYLINKWFFRIIAPILFAIFIYVLILMFFDSVNKLTTHFISFEYFICYLLCFLNFEFTRLLINITNKKFHDTPNKQILYQIILSLSISLIITSLLIHIYFRFIVGIQSIKSELIIFNSLLCISVLLYNMLHISQLLLSYKHTETLKQQKTLKQQAHTNWLKFQNKINPTLLYQSLEYLIGLAHKNKDQANIFVSKISNIYRNILNIKDEIISIDLELEQLNRIKELYADISNGQICIEIVNDIEQDKFFITPGFLLLQVQNIINNSIVNHIQNLEIEIYQKKESIQIQYNKNDKLVNNKNHNILLKAEIESLNWYTQKQILIKTEGKKELIEIPLIKINE